MINIKNIISFLEMTSWEMEKPEAYGVFHLSFFLIGLLLSFLIALLLKNKSDKTFRRVMLGVGIFLAITEVYKQLFYVYVINDGLYPWWIFPFQLCSIPMYLCIVIGFMKPNRIREHLCDFLASYNLMGGFVAFLEPSGLLHEHLTLTLHAFIWHMLLVFIGIYIVLSKNGVQNTKNFKYTTYVYFLLCLIAFIINILLWKVSDGTVNMFYIGPANSPIIVFKTICEKFGWYINTPIYMACVTLGASIFYYPLVKINEGRLK